MDIDETSPAPEPAPPTVAEVLLTLPARPERTYEAPKRPDPTPVAGAVLHPPKVH